VKGTLQDIPGCLSGLLLLPFPQDWVAITEGGRLHKDVNEKENTVITMLELYWPGTLTFFVSPIYLAKWLVQFWLISPSV